MKRRNFLQNSLAACLAGTLTESAVAAEAAGKSREIYELRTYTLKPAKKPILDEYLGKAFIPALHRFGAGPVGAFSENLGPDKMAIYVLTVFNSPDQCLNLPERLASDDVLHKAETEYWEAPAADPVYERIESSLHRAIEALPKLQKPDATQPRILNLRIYESPSERAAKKKIEMFNLHELPIFLRVGLQPVFFGETIVGSRMPNLTYMLTFPDDAARTAAWGRFGADEEWKKLKAMPEYADKEIVSKITNKILTPESYSEI